MLVGPLSESLSPEPILASIEDYHGVIVDLSTSLVVQPHALANARWTLARKMSESGLRRANAWCWPWAMGRCSLPPGPPC